MPPAPSAWSLAPDLPDDASEGAQYRARLHARLHDQASLVSAQQAVQVAQPPHNILNNSLLFAQPSTTSTLPLNLLNPLNHERSEAIAGEAERALCNDLIVQREELVHRLAEVYEAPPHQSASGGASAHTPLPPPSYSSSKADILALRRLTLAVVEAIVAWRKSIGAGNPVLSLPSILSTASKAQTPSDASADQADRPPPFLFNNRNYLLTLLSPIPLPPNLVPLGVTPHRNPFLLLLPLDQMAISPTTTTNMLVDDDVSSVNLLRIRRACDVILTEERLGVKAPQPVRGRSRTRGGAANSQAINPRLNASPYNRTPGPSRSPSRSPSPYHAPPFRPSTTPGRVVGTSGRVRGAREENTRQITPQASQTSSIAGTAVNGMAWDDQPPSVAEYESEATRTALHKHTLKPLDVLLTNVTAMRSTLDHLSDTLTARGLIDAPLTATNLIRHDQSTARPRTTGDNMRRGTHALTSLLLPDPLLPSSSNPRSRGPDLAAGLGAGLHNSVAANIHTRAPLVDNSTLLHLTSNTILPNNPSTPVMLKYHLGLKHTPMHEYPHVTARPLRIECWDVKNKRRITACTLHPITVDRLLGLAPWEMKGMVAQDLVRILGKLEQKLVLSPEKEETVTWEEEVEEEVEVEEDDRDHEEVVSEPESDGEFSVQTPVQAAEPKTPPPKATKIITKMVVRTRQVPRYCLTVPNMPSSLVSTHPDLLLNKIMTTITVKHRLKKDSESSFGNTLALTITRSNTSTPNDNTTLLLPPHQLSLLLLPHYSLYIRSLTKFSALKSLADHLVQRINVTTPWNSTARKLDVTFDRTLSLPSKYTNTLPPTTVLQTHSPTQPASLSITCGGNPFTVSLATMTALSVPAALTPTVTPYSQILDRIKGDGSFERELYREVNAISGRICEVGVRVLEGGELLFECCEVDVGGGGGKTMQIAEPLILSVADCGEILRNKLGGADSAAVARMCSPAHWKELGREAIQHLSLSTGESGSLKLVSPLFTKSWTVNVTLNDTKVNVANLEVNNHTTLEKLRALLIAECNEASLPASYRFYYKGVVCSKVQEKSRFVKDLGEDSVVLKCDNLPDKVLRTIEKDKLKVEKDKLVKEKELQNRLLEQKLEEARLKGAEEQPDTNPADAAASVHSQHSETQPSPPSLKKGKSKKLSPPNTPLKEEKDEVSPLKPALLNTTANMLSPVAVGGGLGKKKRDTLVKPKPKVIPTATVPIDAIFTFYEGGRYVYCDRDLTHVIEPGTTIRIGNPNAPSVTLVATLPPHKKKELEEKLANEEKERRNVEWRRMKEEDCNVAFLDSDDEGEVEVPDKVRDEMARQQDVIKRLQKQLQEFLLKKTGGGAVEKEGLFGLLNAATDTATTSKAAVPQKTASSGRPVTPPLPLPAKGDVFTVHFLTLTEAFDAAKNKKQPYKKKKKNDAGAKSPRGKKEKGSPKAERSKEPLFKRPEKRGESPKRINFSPKAVQRKAGGEPEAGVVPPGSPNKMLQKRLTTRVNKAAEEEEEFVEEGLAEGTPLPSLKVWKVVPKSHDNRRRWRMMYDNDEVPYGSDFTSSVSSETQFGVSIRWGVLEEWCRDVKISRPNHDTTMFAQLKRKFAHQQRVTMFPKLPASTILDEAYKSVCSSTIPVTTELDGTKWAKFVKDIDLFPENMRRTANNMVDLAFTRQVAKNKEGKTKGEGAARVIDIEGFTHAIMEVAQIRFPDYKDPKFALSEVLLDYVAMLPDINGRCWREAKKMAMRNEAKMQCSVIRIQTDLRMMVKNLHYFLMRRGAILVQKWARSVFYNRVYVTHMERLLFDRAVRQRYKAVKMIAKAFKAHVVHEVYMENVRRKIAESRRALAEWRMALKKKRADKEKTYLHRETTSINGTLCNILWARKDGRDCSLDLSIVMTVYVPETSGEFKFDISEKEIKEFAEKDRLQGNVSYGETMDPRNLMKLKGRLKCRLIKDKARPGVEIPIFKYSRKSQSERGVLMTARGFDISHMAIDKKLGELVKMKGRLYIAKAFRSNDAITFVAYDPKTCQTLKAIVTIGMLNSWIRSEEISKMKQAHNARRNRVAEAHKKIGLYKIGVKYDDEEILDCIRIIEGWLEERRENSVSVVPALMAGGAGGKKKGAGGAERSSGGSSGKKKKKMTSREIQLAAVMDAEEGEDDDEHDEVVGGEGVVAVIDNNPQDGGGDEEKEEEVAARVPIPSEMELPIEAILGGDENAMMMDKDPYLLRKGNEYELVFFLLQRLNVFVGTKKGSKVHYARKHVLMFQHDVEVVVRSLSAEKLQGLWRMRQARKYIKEVIKERFEKRFTKTNRIVSGVFIHGPGYYYIDPSPRCRLVFATKPIGLRRDDLEEPEDAWMIDQDEGGSSVIGEKEEPKTLWINPATGQESYLSLDQNAKILQKLIRTHLAAALGSPTLGEMIRAIKFQREAAERYAEFPEKLSACVNYALLCHTHEFDFDTAQMLYKDAMLLSPENPVLLRSYALFRLMQCEAPRQEVWGKCNDMFRAAYLRDPEGSKFQMCEDAFFHFSVIQQPAHSKALLNFALVNQCIHKKYELADRLYRMALRFSPNDKLVQKNYSDFLEEQLPGGQYFVEDIGPNGTIEQRSKIVEEREEWGEWTVKVDREAKDERFSRFWYNILTSKTRWVEPRWEGMWKGRVKRSQEVRQLGNFKEWYDSKLGTYFYQDVEYEAAKDREKGVGLGLGLDFEEHAEAGEMEFMVENPFGEDDE